MPPKKKTVKTEELPTETETITETTENIEVPEDTCIQKPKKPKRELTEKQKLNFAKLQEANKVRYAEKKRLKEEGLNNKIQEVEIKKEEVKPTTKPVVEKVQEEEEESEEELVVKKKKPVKKKKKQKIIIEDSDSSSDNEIIIRRSKGRKKSKPIDIPVPEPMIDITPIEEKKEEPKKEEEDLNKKYSAKQILKGLGL